MTYREDKAKPNTTRELIRDNRNSKRERDSSVARATAERISADITESDRGTHKPVCFRNLNDTSHQDAYTRTSRRSSTHLTLLWVA